MPQDDGKSHTAIGAQFAATSWTNILAAQRTGSPESGAALEKLCCTYWYPLYAYLRRKGSNPHEAQDLTQEFFYRLINDNYLGAVDRRRGKFRSFLLAALNHFVSNQRDYDRAAKRGGGMTIISLEAATEGETRFLREPSLELSPEKIFERNWFLALFDHALARLREEVGSGRTEIFDQLKQFIIDDAEAGDYNAAAPRVNMTPNAVAVTVHRWRERYKTLVREEIIRTVVDPSEIDEELRRFFSMLAQ
ncbi:MAG TPA: sigma-70 family RNA polymerase sigma factor [Candidatus Binatia bacterium]|nr:sigma-70 family RNA polymerase sigma factor [Candidatus Binatia bacterium]